MVDYKQKAWEHVGEFVSYAEVVEKIATTLEALDKAEAERDALRGELAAFRAKVSKAMWVVKAFHDPMTTELVANGSSLRFSDFIQPEPDPLVEKIISEVGAAQTRDPHKPWHEHMRELFRHGLAVKEVTRHD